MAHFHKHLSKTILSLFLPLLFSAGIFIFSSSLSTQATGETAYWKFDETSGTSASDSSGNNLTGTLVNGPAWVAGKSGNGLQFDGVNDYVELNNPSSFPSGTSSRSMCLWLKPSTLATPTYGTYLFFYGTRAANQAMYIATESNGRVYGGAWASDIYSANNFLTANTWSHVCLTHDSTTATLYGNGQVLGTTNSTGWNLVKSIAQINVNYAGTHNYNGAIDEVKLFNRALTLAEVQADYDAGTVPDTTPPVISGEAASSITSSGATITWTTDEASDTQIEYGTTLSYGNSTTLNLSMVASHSQALTNLTSSTLYHYRVKSKDGAGNLATGTDKTFTTAEVYVPVLTSITVSPATASVGIGSTQTFNATPKDQNGNLMTGITINWISSDTGIARVAPGIAVANISTGEATGVALGTATITASSGGISGSAGLTVTEASTACTFYVDDDGTGDFNVNHSDDAVEINQAINRANVCAVNLQAGNTYSNPAEAPKGTVILRKTTTPYDISTTSIVMQSHISLEGEFDDVTLSLTTIKYEMLLSRGKTNIGIKHLTFDGNVYRIPAKNACQGGLYYKGFDCMAVHVVSSNYVDIQNITGRFIGADLIQLDGSGSGNVNVKNIRYTNSGHSGVGVTENTGMHDLTIDNVYCKDIGNTCVRLDGANGVTIKNMYAEDTGSSSSVPAILPDFSLEFGIQISNTGSSNNININIENITVVGATNAGILIWDQTKLPTDNTRWYGHTINIKNALIDCRGDNPNNNDNRCSALGAYAGGPGGIVIDSINNVTIDGATITNAFKPGVPAIKLNNKKNMPMEVTIKNSVLANNAGGYGILKSGSVTDTIKYSDFYNNAFGSISSGSLDGTNILTNPLFASSTDFHLKSPYGRWTSSGYVYDPPSELSPAVGAGDPSTVIANCPSLGCPSQVEMGAYGNTVQASIGNDPATASRPIISPNPSSPYKSPLTVEIKSLTAGASIRYTIDGSTPTSSTPASSNPITLTLNSNTTIKAIATKSGLNDSAVISASYTVYIPIFTSISISPASSSILKGATQTFTATPQDQFNNPMPGITIA
ncbi:MAG: LamG-like jellyroll fold domain-containing protein, partial [Candidatus Paceibacterota bacterium]